MNTVWIVSYYVCGREYNLVVNFTDSYPFLNRLLLFFYVIDIKDSNNARFRGIGKCITHVHKSARACVNILVMAMKFYINVYIICLNRLTVPLLVWHASLSIMGCLQFQICHIIKYRLTPRSPSI